MRANTKKIYSVWKPNCMAVLVRPFEHLSIAIRSWLRSNGGYTSWSSTTKRLLIEWHTFPQQNDVRWFECNGNRSISLLWNLWIECQCLFTLRLSLTRIITARLGCESAFHAIRTYTRLLTDTYFVHFQCCLLLRIFI